MDCHFLVTKINFVYGNLLINLLGFFGQLLYSFYTEQRAAAKNKYINITALAPVVYDSSSQATYDIAEAEYAHDDLLPLMGC